MEQSKPEQKRIRKLKIIEIIGNEEWVNDTLRKSLVTPENPIFRATTIGTIRLLEIMDLPNDLDSINITTEIITGYKFV